MLSIFFYSFCTLFLYSTFGFFIKKKTEANNTYFTDLVIYGIITISFIALVINFFAPLSKNINSLLFIPCLLIFIKFREQLNTKKFYSFLLFGSFLSTILLFASHTYRPDAGLYHLPFVNILNEEKIIFGLTNLHFRYGHTSILQYLSAINLNIFFGINGIVIPSALIASTIIINFLIKFRNAVENNNYDFHFFYILSILIYIFFKMNRYSEYGNDAPAHFITFYLFSEYLNSNKKINLKKILNLSILSVFIVLNKFTLVGVLLLPLILLIKNNLISISILKKFKFYFILLFGILWLFKNIIISGCIIFPIHSTCIEKIKWTNIISVKKISIENEAFSKNWPSYKNRISTTQQEYIKNFNWVNTWLKKFTNEQREKLFAFILLLLTIYILLIFKSENVKKHHNPKMMTLTSILIFLTTIWFLKTPDYRYAYSIIVSLVSIPFAYLLSKRKFNSTSNKLFFSLIFIFFLAFLLKNFNRIIFTEKYLNYPFPRYNSHNNDNKKVLLNFKMINGKKIFIQKEGYCMYSKAPCTPYEINIEIIKKNGFLFFLKKV